MGDQEAIEPTRVTKAARPWSGFFLGLIFGLALAIVLQQAGAWPLDRLLLFGAAGLFGLIGILLAGAGRERVGAFSSILPLILAVALIAFGATGLASLNELGELNGGCTVDAASDLDTTVVTDTSRQDPFDIDPNGGLSWVATSPAPIMDHLWNIYVDVGGFLVPIAGNEAPDPNSDGDQENIGDVADVSGYVQDVSDYTGLELGGAFIVGGDIEGSGGACDGFGFVRLTADPFATLIAQIAAGIALVTLIGLLVLAFNRTREAEMVHDDEAVDDTSYAGVGGAPGTAAGGGGMGRDDEEEPPAAGGAQEWTEDEDLTGDDSGGQGRHSRDDT
jgi:hypothetical protein